MARYSLMHHTNALGIATSNALPRYVCKFYTVELQSLSGLILCFKLQCAALPAPVVHEFCSLYEGLDFLHIIVIPWASSVTTWEAGYP